MSAEYPAGVVNLYGEQLALTTALASLGLPGIETKQAIIYCHGSDFRLHINPALVAAYVYDNSLTGAAKWVDRSVAVQDRASIGTGTAMDSLTTSDRLFLCFSDVTGGVYVDLGSANDQGNNITASYWNGSAWTSLSATDNTDTGASLATSGTITWTAPTDALMARLGAANNNYASPVALIDSGLTNNEALDSGETDITMSADPSSTIVAGDLIKINSEVYQVVASSATGSLLTVVPGFLGSTEAAHNTGQTVYLFNTKCPSPVQGFWVELKWNATMGTNTEIANVWALNKNTNRGFFHAGVEYPFSFDRRNTGAIEALISTGGAVLDVNWIRTVI